MGWKLHTNRTVSRPLSTYPSLSQFSSSAGSGKSWKHEDGSEMMFDYLVSDNNIKIAREDQEFIKALISGERSRA